MFQKSLKVFSTPASTDISNETLYDTQTKCNFQKRGIKDVQLNYKAVGLNFNKMPM